MTLLEVVIVSGIFSLLVMVAFASLQSVRVFTRTNSTQIDLQESARHAMERITDTLQNTGNFAEAGGKVYPRLFNQSTGIPASYDTANQHPPKVDPKARVGSMINGGDPRGDSDEVIFKLPVGYPDYPGGTPAMNGGSVTWQNSEYGFFVVPGPDNTNQLEFRSAAESAAQILNGQQVQGTVICRNVDRFQVDDITRDPSLAFRQLRVTLYLTRYVPTQGVLKADTEAFAQSILMVSLSGIVDLRNSAQLDNFVAP